MKKIVIFTSNTKGGVIQLVEQLCRELMGLSYEIKCFVPETIEGSKFIAESDKVEKYTKFNTVYASDSRVKEVARKIADWNPDLVWFADSAILSCEVCLAAQKNGLKCMVTFHDAADFHPTNNVSIKKRLHDMFVNRCANKVIQKADVLLTLSDVSRKKLGLNYPAQKQKIKLMTLGAHIPEVESERPDELKKETRDYLLFFGRIDKYKGLSTLFTAYAETKDKKPSLIVAGSGKLSDEEKKLCEKSKAVLINRYISDSEMIWLFENSLALVLPYIEASQSGIIPIAYHYGKPVIVSDVPGLTQFVEDKKTGYICHNDKDYIDAFHSIGSSEILGKMRENTKIYSHARFDWQENIKNLLKSVV